ncbi:MAG TPA: 3-dehydroquinate synthase [Pantanalinema sp.]
MENLILLGFMGAGKSTVGAIIADRLGWDFVDLDEAISREAGRSVAELFETEGEHGFRAREKEALARACARSHQVIAPGGGAVLDPDNVRLMAAAGTVVVLHAPPEKLWRRVQGTDRPLAQDREGFLRRYREREARYAAFPIRISTSFGHPGLAADAILSRCFGPSRTVRVALGARSYEVSIEPNALASLGERMGRVLKPGPCMVVTNPTVQRLYGEAAKRALEAAGWEPVFGVVPDSEGAKSLKEAERLYDLAVERRLERQSPVVALGGGVVGDLAGFVAATYQRGVPLVQVPTTLLSQIDSSVGGKVAVNHPRGKNLIGAFHQPALVVADPLVLHSLSDREWRAGLAELVKYGVILDAPFFDRLAADLPLLQERTLSALVPAIARACELKAQVVAEDEREGGLRAILNFGHTVGHAIEAVTRYRSFLHGEAVAIGMVAAGAIARELGMWAASEHERLVAWLKEAGLPVEIRNLPVRALMEAMAHDKKVQDGRLHFVLSEAIGRVTLRSDVPGGVVEKVLRDLGAN